MEFEEIVVTIPYYFDLVWNSLFFSVLKFLVTIYVIIVFLDIVMILYLRGVGVDIIKKKYGADMPAAHKKTTRKKWKTVEEHIKSHKSTDWKVAILAADGIVGDVLEMVGLPGENFRDRVEHVSPERLEQKEELLRVHKIRNAIIKDHSLDIGQEDARDVIAVYKDFLERWEAL